MMSLITKSRRQNAIYWPPTQPDSYGRAGFGPLVELVFSLAANYRVRWVDKIEEIVDSTGTKTFSRARVYVPQLPDGSEVQPGGVLWLGDRADLTSEAAPLENAAAYPIQSVAHCPDIRARERLRTAWL